MKRKIYLSGESIFQLIDILLLLSFSVLILLPICSVVVTSFVSEAEIVRRGSFILIPEKFDFSAYRMFWSSRRNIIRAYGNTLFRVSVGTGLDLAVTIPLAYGLSKKNLKGRTLLTGYIFITMLFGGGLVPSYVLVKTLGLLDSRWALILPGLVGTWNMLVMRNFFMAIPDSLEEAATIDGANSLDILLKVVLPLSKASVATIGLFYAVGHWNAWFDAMLYINTSAKLPMQNILRDIIMTSTGMGNLGTEGYAAMDIMPPTQAIRAACIVITTAPILFVYPFIQKYFVKGVMVGGVKG